MATAAMGEATEAMGVAMAIVAMEAATAEAMGSAPPAIAGATAVAATGGEVAVRGTVPTMDKCMQIEDQDCKKRMPIG